MRLLTVHDRRLSPTLTDRREQRPAVEGATAVVEAETSMPLRRGGWEAQVSRLRGRVEDAWMLIQEDLNETLREPLATLGRDERARSEEQQAQLQAARGAFVQALQSIEQELRRILLPFEDAAPDAAEGLSVHEQEGAEGIALKKGKERYACFRDDADDPRGRGSV